MPQVSRRRWLLAGALALVAFLLVSALLARVFSADGAERTAITNLIDSEARGDAPALRAQIAGCSTRPACRARIAATAATLRRPGKVTILQLNTSAGFSLSTTLGTARVAWKTPGSLPIVQCVRVRRSGNVLSGLRIELLELSRRIRSDADCPRRY